MSDCFDPYAWLLLKLTGGQCIGGFWNRLNRFRQSRGWKRQVATQAPELLLNTLGESPVHRLNARENEDVSENPSM